MTLRIAVLPGDGIGPEVIAEATRVLRTVGLLTGVDLTLTEYPFGATAMRAGQPALPGATLDACLAADAVLLGAVGDPAFDTHAPHARPEAGLLELRRALGGFANLRPVACGDALAVGSPLDTDRVRGADLLIVRELLGGLYYGTPRGTGQDGESAWNTMRYTRAEVARVAHVAFQQAQRRRRRLASVDKANVLETSRLWRAVVDEVAADYPDVALEHVLVDTCAMRLLTEPRAFDVILTANLFGDILSDESAAWPGSIGVLGSATIGGAVGLFEPVHGSAPDLAGTGTANPIGAIASAALLLRHAAGLDAAADDIERAIDHVLGENCRPRDLAVPGVPWLTTAQVGELVDRTLSEMIEHRYAYHAV